MVGSSSLAMAKSKPLTPPRTIDERFDEVSQAFADAHDYTTFCFSKLHEDTRQGLKAMESRLTRRLDRHESLLTEVLAEVKALRPR